jgi:hypothetical protein
MTTGFWWSGGGIICVLQTHFIFFKSLLTKQLLNTEPNCRIKLEKKYAPALDNFGQSCFVRSDLKKMKCVCKTQMMPPPDHQNPVVMHTSIMCINILQNIKAVAPIRQLGSVFNKIVKSIIYLLFSYQTGYIMWEYIYPKPGMSHYISCLIAEKHIILRI